eukprot:GHVN01067797.1.p1 GENE.GHVN01067797.1~~GHVN01067797.1.p1  ORF type:complete len:103 (-),score=9.09 GHVN01067797.1:353-661(-)
MGDVKKQYVPAGYVLCQMAPLRQCLHANEYDMSKCVPQVLLFEETCSREVSYVHDNTGVQSSQALPPSKDYGHKKFERRLMELEERYQTWASASSDSPSEKK